MIKILQVEKPGWGGGSASAPNPSCVRGGASVAPLMPEQDNAYPVDPDTQKRRTDPIYSSHASEVLEIITGSDYPNIPSPVSRVSYMDDTDFAILRLGASNFPGDMIAEYPKEDGHQIHNHSYGSNPSFPYEDVMQRYRYMEDNTSLVFALPNNPPGQNVDPSLYPLWYKAEFGTKVGSRRGWHVGNADIVGRHDWTSHNAPEVAFAKACILAEYEKKNLPYSGRTALYWLKAYAKINEYGQPQLELETTLAAVRALLVHFPARPAKPPTGEGSIEIERLTRILIDERNKVQSLHDRIEQLSIERPAPSIPGVVVATSTQIRSQFDKKPKLGTHAPIKFKRVKNGELVSGTGYFEKASGTFIVS